MIRKAQKIPIADIDVFLILRTDHTETFTACQMEGWYPLFHSDRSGGIPLSRSWLKHIYNKYLNEDLAARLTFDRLRSLGNSEYARSSPAQYLTGD